MADRHHELAKYEPTKTIDEIVVELNRLYHALEARIYDGIHPEIFKQLPNLWGRMLKLAFDTLTGDSVDTLDFGCGTGFATEQLLAHASRGRLGLIFCYDLSPEMIRQCREKLTDRCEPVEFLSSEQDLDSRIRELGGVDLILTNSVLHHLHDWSHQAVRFHRLLRSGGVWLSGHEPSVRFLQNPACCEAYAAYLRSTRWRRYLSAKRYWHATRRLVGITAERDLLWKVAIQARKQGLFRKAVHPRLIGSLIDYHVPHTPEEAASRGLSPDTMTLALQDMFDLLSCETYSFLGPVPEGSLSQKWQRRAERLRAEFPRDGQHFSAAWRKKEGPESATPSVETP